MARGSKHHNERLWERKAYEDERIGHRGGYVDAKRSPARDRAAMAWCEIAKALAASEDIQDRKLCRAVVNYARSLPGVRVREPERRAQRKLPGLERTLAQRTRQEPGWER